MARTLTAGLVQYRLITAEKELIEQTLRGSIQVLTDVLGLVNPAAFSRAVRIRKHVRHVVAALNLSNNWMFEVAAMMSQLGCVTLHPETVDAVMQARQSLRKSSLVSTPILELVAICLPISPAWSRSHG